MENNVSSFNWFIGELPFIWGPLAESSNPDMIPDRLPFSLCLDCQTCNLMQLSNAGVKEALALAYQRGSLMGVMEDTGINQRYSDSFIQFLQSKSGRLRFEGLHILEIGSGTGHLLKRFNDLGAEVLGLEPGIHGQEAAKHYNLPIIQAFFPTQEIKGVFDLIVMANVLEHIEDPLKFLREVKGHVHSGSKVAISVPNCEPYIAQGDISMLIHEHWSYFTEATLKTTLYCAGGRDLQIEASGYGGNLYAWFELCGEPVSPAPEDLEKGKVKAQQFQQKAQAMIKRIALLIYEAQREGKTIGLYIPSRAINALTISKTGLDGCRFFDDSQSLEGTFFPGISVPIESRQGLLSCPTDILLILSHTFGKRLAEELRPDLPARTEIITWEDLFC
jgi:2-polyprenyl-3-methyl-5-hydroxy-6-metoxy-1,4-benzoquinol methylase